MLNLFYYDFGVRLIKPDPNIYYRTLFERRAVIEHCCGIQEQYILVGKFYELPQNIRTHIPGIHQCHGFIAVDQQGNHGAAEGIPEYHQMPPILLGGIFDPQQGSSAGKVDVIQIPATELAFIIDRSIFVGFEIKYPAAVEHVIS